MNRGHPPRGGLKVARIQRHPSVYTKTAYEEGYMDYNIWYHRHFGRKKDELEGKPKAEARCNVKEDCGWTKGWEKDDTFVCIFFAKGICCFGENCEYIHFPPTTRHERNMIPTYDCFGRERFGTDREDMGGVGNFNRTCKLLQVTGIVPYHDQKLEEVLFRHFLEWGRLEYVRVVNEKTALVKFQNRGSAEFAKEAMEGQSLDQGEVLEVKWAKEDPKDAEIEQLKLKILAKNPNAFAHAPSYSDRQLEELLAGAMSAGLVAPYPVTDAQFPASVFNFAPSGDNDEPDGVGPVDGENAPVDGEAQAEAKPRKRTADSDSDHTPDEEPTGRVLVPAKKKFKVLSKTAGEEVFKAAPPKKAAPVVKKKKGEEILSDEAIAAKYDL